MAGAEVKHQYHLVNPSPWPLIGAAAATALMIGAVMWMKSGAGESGLVLGVPDSTGAYAFSTKGSWLFFAGLAGVIVTMIGWWRDVVKESLTGENTSTVVRLGLRYGMVLFIASEVMFFAAWFWAFFGAALFPDAREAVTLVDGAQMLNTNGDPAFLGNDARLHATGGVWPPKGVEPLDPWGLPLINTLILLLSGTTVTWAHHAVVHNDQKGLVQGLVQSVKLVLDPAVELVVGFVTRFAIGPIRVIRTQRVLRGVAAQGVAQVPGLGVVESVPGSRFPFVGHGALPRWAQAWYRGGEAGALRPGPWGGSASTP